MEIVQDKEICGGKACIKGTRIRVIDIVQRYKLLKEKPEEIAAAFDIPIEKVFLALLYYYQHPSEMKQEMQQEKAFVERVKTELKSAAYAT